VAHDDIARQARLRIAANYGLAHLTGGGRRAVALIDQRCTMALAWSIRAQAASEGESEAPRATADVRHVHPRSSMTVYARRSRQRARSPIQYAIDDGLRLSANPGVTVWVDRNFGNCLASHFASLRRQVLRRWQGHIMRIHAAIAVFALPVTGSSDAIGGPKRA
jgi:hypothetical protein